MSQRVDLAVVGATTLVGETLVELLESREFPVGELYLLDDERAAGKRVEFRGHYATVRAVDGFDFSKVGMAIFVGSATMAAEHGARAAAAGILTLDSSGAFREQPDVPVVVPEVNAEALHRRGSGNIVVSPDPMTVQLALALKPLEACVGLDGVVVATYQAVSDSGRRGIEELGRQTADLLNLREIKAAVYPRQIAFNVLGRNGTADSDGYTATERAVARETSVLLARSDLPISVSAALVPVFYGHCAAVHVKTREPLDVHDAKRLLRAAPAIELLDEHGSEADFPTPVTDAAHHDAVFVGRVRTDLSDPRGLNFWVVADNVRRGAALNVLQIAEMLARDDA